MLTKQDIERIDAFIENRLDHLEEKVLERRLKSDSRLQRAFEFHIQMRKAIDVFYTGELTLAVDELLSNLGVDFEVVTEEEVADFVDGILEDKRREELVKQRLTNKLLDQQIREQELIIHAIELASQRNLYLELNSIHKDLKKNGFIRSVEKEIEEELSLKPSPKKKHRQPVVEETVKKDKQKVKRYDTRKILFVVSILLLGLFLFFPRKKKYLSKQLYKDYYQGLEDYISLGLVKDLDSLLVIENDTTIVMSRQDSLSHQRAKKEIGQVQQNMFLYNKRLFHKAIPTFIENLRKPKNGVEPEILQLYLGISYMGLSDAKNAQESFEPLFNSNEFPLRDEVQWYLALTYLLENNQEQCRVILELRPNNKYKNQVEKLLSKLE